MRIQTNKSALAIALLLVTSPNALASVCPEQFHQVPVPNDASICRSFSDDNTFPAILSFHSPSQPNQLLTFYNAADLPIKTEKKQYDRVLLQATNEQYSIVISHDNQGSQVDILVRF